MMVPQFMGFLISIADITIVYLSEDDENLMDASSTRPGESGVILASSGRERY